MTAEVHAMYPPIDHVVAVIHPFAKNIHHGERDLANLQNDFGLPVRPVQTVPDRAETTSTIADMIQPESLVMVLGGDGTVNVAARAILKSGQEPLLVATRSGNACDFARATNGRRSASDVYMMSQVGRGTIPHRRIAPMLLDITHPDRVRTQQELAMNYAGFGFTALSSSMLNEPWHSDRQSPAIQKAHRLAREASILTRAARDSDNLTGTINGRPYRGADISIVHSRHMAKVARPPITHYDPELLVAITKQGLPANTYAMARLMLGLQVGERHRKAELTIDAATIGHVDAEPFAVEPQSHIRAYLAPRGIRILSAE